MMNLSQRETDFNNRIIDDHFILEEKIEMGGMSFLFLGKDQSSEKQVVVKICRNASELKRFNEEIKLLRSVHHPGIQKIIVSGMIEDVPYYVVPYYGKENFREYLSPKTVLPEKVILDYFLQITDAVAYLHRKKILHNDLKPQNILMNGESHLILNDFGLASKVSLSKHLPDDQKSIWGSPVYLAPELPQGFNPTYASDVYSLGIILFILVLGYPPFYNDDLATLIKMHQKNAPPYPHVLSTSISEDLENIMLCAISKSPKDRFASAGKMQDAILAYKKKFQSQIETNTIPRHPEILSLNQEKTKPIQCNP